MDANTRDDAIQRLKSTAGHINGIVRMLEDDRYCIDVIKQIQAAQAALNRVNEAILDGHLRTCVTTAIQGDDSDERERVLREVTEVFRYSNKSSS
jgi:DNA-binding FrmR family transcriptional regulator